MEAVEYFSKDFEWEELRAEVENDPSFRCHLLPFESSNSSSQKAAEEDSASWKRFHVRHSSGKFFKERRYLLQEFPELVSCGEHSKVLEVGCGNGSTALPILRGNEHSIVYACDCSSETLERAEEIIGAATVASVGHRFHTFCCNFSTTGFPKWLACHTCREVFLQKQQNCLSDVKENNGRYFKDSYSLKESDCCIGGVDFVTLIDSSFHWRGIAFLFVSTTYAYQGLGQGDMLFGLSTIGIWRMPTSIKECFSVLKPGGMLLFRDYGLYDMTMLRFESDQRVEFREYMRSDGTRSYFFCLDTVRDLFLSAGFIELELEYCCVKSVNRRNGKSMLRVWVHGKFQKPM